MCPPAETVLLHNIQVAARRAGLSPALLRAWERRYSAVEPVRSESGQRLYSDPQIERLRRLRLATEAGHRIGDVARVSNDALDRLLREDLRISEARFSEGARRRKPSFVIDALLRRILHLDERELERELRRASILCDPFELLDDLIAPLMERVGEAWTLRQLDAGHEHLASEVIRRVLHGLLRELRPSSTAPAPSILITTPHAERHDLGALGVAVAAAAADWNPHLLGPDLPAASILLTARKLKPAAVALSITYGASGGLEHEILKLREGLEPRVHVLVGGASSEALQRVLDRAGIIRLERARDVPTALHQILDPSVHERSA